MIEIKQGGGWWILFGAPFLLGGILVVRTIFRSVQLAGASGESWWRLPLLSLMSVVLLLIGAAMCVVRRWLTLDTLNGSLVRSTGLLVPMWSTHLPLSEFSAVVIAYESGDSDSPDHYPVRLRGMIGKDFEIYSPTRFPESRTMAEFLSRFLQLPLADATTDHEVIVSAGKARENLRERLVSDESRRKIVQPPPAMRSEILQTAGKTTIIIPTRTSLRALGFAVLISLALMSLAAPALWRYIHQQDNSSGSNLIFPAMMILFFGILPLLASSHAFGAVRQKIVVTINSEALRIERGGLWGVKTKFVSVGDILDVDCSTVDGMVESGRVPIGYPRTSPASGGRPNAFGALKHFMPSQGIVVKSRQGLLTFGEGLAAGELRYLRWVLANALAG